ncbi:MAG: hypothetical protein OXU20_23155 [Myxococcales bacterium]|nr:hypothetical protein [Myxococcales bacterium]
MFAAANHTRRRQQGRLLCIICILITACSAEVSDDGQKTPLSPDEQETILQFVRSHGFDTSGARFDGSDFILTGDMRVDASTLLQAANHTVEKGYWFQLGGSPVPTPGFPAWVAPFNLGLDWSFAFFFGAVEWNLRTPVEFFWGPPPTGEENAVVVMYWPFDVFPFPESQVPANATTTTMALATFPEGGNVGDAIFVNTNYSVPEVPCGGEDIEAVPWEQKLRTATHELGHVLGFSHPADGMHIEGTERVTATNKYPSIMWPSGGLICPSEDPNDRYETTLSADDITAAEIKFGP